MTGAEALRLYDCHRRACAVCAALVPRCTEGRELFEQWRLSPGVSVMPMDHPELEQLELERAAQRAEARSLSELPEIALQLKRIADVLEARESSAPAPAGESDFCMHQFEVKPSGALRCRLCSAVRLERPRLLQGTPINLLAGHSESIAACDTHVFRARVEQYTHLTALSFACTEGGWGSASITGASVHTEKLPCTLTVGPAPSRWEFAPITAQVSVELTVTVENLSGAPVRMRELAFWGAVK